MVRPLMDVCHYSATFNLDNKIKRKEKKRKDKLNFDLKL